jgi:hypothetical protein
MKNSANVLLLLVSTTFFELEISKTPRGGSETFCKQTLQREKKKSRENGAEIQC